MEYWSQLPGLLDSALALQRGELVMHKTWRWTASGADFILPHEEIQKIYLHAGMAGIEGIPTLFPSQEASALEEIAGSYRAVGPEFDSFHLPCGAENDITSFYETHRQDAVAVSQHWMECAAALGCRVVIQHPTTNRCNAEMEGLDRYITQMGKSLGTLLPFAAGLNLTVALENLPPGERGDSFSARPEHFDRIIAEFADPNLGFCLDTGHALMAGGPERTHDFLDVMAPHMEAFHLADNAGDRDSHLAPGHGSVDWGPVFRKAAQIEHNHTMCIETPPFAPGNHPSYGLDAWKQMIADTDALVAAALS